MNLLQYSRHEDKEYYRIHLREDHNVIIKRTGNGIFALDELPGIYRHQTEDDISPHAYFFLGERRLEELKRVFSDKEREYQFKGVFLPNCDDIHFFFMDYYSQAMQYEENRKKLRSLDGEGYR